MGLEKLPSLLTAKHVRNLIRGENLKKFNENCRLLEVNPTQQFRENYKTSHIPQALFFDTTECTQPSKMYPRPVPNAECFGKYVGSLGISNRHHLILYDRSPFGFFASSRMWWVFRYFGHENVSIIDGGFLKWQKQQGFELTKEEPKYQSEKFEIKENKKLIRDFGSIVENLKSKREQLVDVRDSEEFNKVIDGGVKNHIPNSKNLPYNEFFDKQNACLKDLDQLRKLIKDKKIDLNQPNVSYCLTGMTSATFCYVAYLLGHSSLPLYAGAWSEFSQRK